jgi:hypothetical protein
MRCCGVSGCCAVLVCGDGGGICERLGVWGCAAPPRGKRPRPLGNGVPREPRDGVDIDEGGLESFVCVCERVIE